MSVVNKFDKKSVDRVRLNEYDAVVERYENFAGGMIEQIKVIKTGTGCSS